MFMLLNETLFMLLNDNHRGHDFKVRPAYSIKKRKMKMNRRDRDKLGILDTDYVCGGSGPQKSVPGRILNAARGVCLKPGI
jgi:hypothetical protein